MKKTCINCLYNTKELQSMCNKCGNYQNWKWKNYNYIKPSCNKEEPVNNLRPVLKGKYRP